MGSGEVNLMAIRNILGEIDVPFSLEAGTLLFVLRDDKLDPTDTDIAVNHEGMEKILKHEELFDAYGFRRHKLFTHPSGLASELSLIRDGNKVDIFVKEFRGDKAWSLSFNDEAPRERYYIPHVYPARHFRSYGKVKFRGLEWNIPYEAEDYLTTVYGDWRTPDPNWLWWRDPKCIDYDWKIE